jgi:DNA-binding NtrC family response regulator
VKDERPSNHRKRILMVEDDAVIRRLNIEDLKNHGYLVDPVKDAATGWDTLQMNRYDPLITDQHWPKLSGVELLKKIHAACMTLPAIMVTEILPEREFALHPWIQPASMLLAPYTSKQLLEMVKKSPVQKRSFRRGDSRRSGEWLILVSRVTPHSLITFAGARWQWEINILSSKKESNAQ